MKIKKKCIWKTNSCKINLFQKRLPNTSAVIFWVVFSPLYGSSPPKAMFLERVFNFKMLFLTYRRSKGVMYPWKCDSRLDKAVCLHAAIVNADLSALWSKAVNLSPEGLQHLPGKRPRQQLLACLPERASILNLFRKCAPWKTDPRNSIYSY